MFGNFKTLSFILSLVKKLLIIVVFTGCSVSFDFQNLNSFYISLEETITYFKFKQSLGIDSNFANTMDSFDFDGDGDLDLVLAESNGNSVGVFSNDGSGVFSRHQKLSLSASSSGVYSRILVQDFDNDGFKDLAVTGDSGTLYVWRYDPATQNFGNLIQKAPSTLSSEQIRFIDTADFDKNGYLDVVIAIRDGSGNGSLVILYNDGDMDFDMDEVIVGAGTGNLDPYGVAAQDFNNDGWTDLALTNRDNDKIHIFRNDTGTSFTDVNEFSASVDPSDSTLTDIISVDFNKDGIKDLVWGSECTLGVDNCTYDVYDQFVYVAFGRSGFSFSDTIAMPTNAYGDVRSLTIKDLNNDGFLDVVSVDDSPTRFVFSDGLYTSVSMFAYNNKTKNFDPVVNYMVSPKYDEMGDRITTGATFSNATAVGDFDGDHRIDFVVDSKINNPESPSSVHVYLTKEKEAPVAGP